MSTIFNNIYNLILESLAKDIVNELKTKSPIFKIFATSYPKAINYPKIQTEQDIFNQIKQQVDKLSKKFPETSDSLKQYVNNPFFQFIIINSFKDETLNSEILKKLFDVLDSWKNDDNPNVKELYQELSVDSTTAKKEWIIINSGEKDKNGFRDNLTKLTNIAKQMGLCTKNIETAEEYLKDKTFHVLFQNDKPVAIITVNNNKTIDEIIGKYNTIPFDYCKTVIERAKLLNTQNQSLYSLSQLKQSIKTNASFKQINIGDITFEQYIQLNRTNKSKISFDNVVKIFENGLIGVVSLNQILRYMPIEIKSNRRLFNKIFIQTISDDALTIYKLIDNKLFVTKNKNLVKHLITMAMGKLKRIQGLFDAIPEVLKQDLPWFNSVKEIIDNKIKAKTNVNNF